MKKQIETWFITEDGARFQDEQRAREHETLLIALMRVMAPLGPCVRERFLNTDGFARHDREVVREVKAGLVDLSRPIIGEWLASQEHVHGNNPQDIHASWFHRLLDGGLLCAAWERLCCFDQENREWNQSFYAAHPERGGDTDHTLSRYELAQWVVQQQDEAARIEAALEEGVGA